LTTLNKKQKTKTPKMQLTKTKTDVIIDQTIDHLTVHCDFLRLFCEPKQILADIPILQINSIMIMGSMINIPGRLIKMCNKHEIPLHLLTDYYKHNGSIYFSSHSNIHNRIAQFQACSSNPDKDWKLYLAKQILHQKTQTQILALLQWNFDPKDLTKLQAKISNLKSHQSLMGNEGTSAVLYWDKFGRVLHNTQQHKFDQQKPIESQVFLWKGRIKNPCLDPINSLLSLAYSLLSTQCQTSLTMKGLDSYLGILHTTNEDRPALVYDIMEVYRVLLVDFWVLGLVENRVFGPQDFCFTQKGICTLQSDKKNEFFRLWFKRLKYQKFDTNKGKITIHEFMNSNAELLIDWFNKINNHKERNTNRFDKLPERLIVFTNIEQFKSI
jgi:CRISP-associated protein Cas1